MKRLLALLIIGVFLVGGVWVFVAHRNSLQQVTLSTDSGQVLNVYDGAYDGDGHTAVKLGTAIRTVTTTDTFKLKKGGYTVVLQDDKKQYASTLFSLTVADEPVSLDVKPGYSPAGLQTLLASEEPQIRSVLTSKYPQIGKSFSLAAGSLYRRGEWYAALLKPTDPSVDTYRIVLNKKDGHWSLAVDQPEIIISQVKYPAIPGSVLSDVDNFKR